MTIRTLDLFCGAGGSSWGARDAGATIIAGVDSWDIATTTFQENFPGAMVFKRKLTRQSNRRIIEAVGKIDLLLASPECTNHTCAKGKTARDEGSRRTVLHAANYIKVLDPRWFVIENVTSMKNWSGYDGLLRRLRKTHRVREQEIEATCHGVPQSRERLFIFGDREADPLEVLPSRAGKPPMAAEIIARSDKYKMRPLRSSGYAIKTLERADKAIAALGNGVPYLIVYYGSDGAGGWQPLDRPLRTITTLDRFALVEWRDGVEYMRMLQPDELAKAMGYGKDLKLLKGSRRDRIKLLGNGVCPPVMRDIVKALVGGPSIQAMPLLAAE